MVVGDGNYRCVGADIDGEVAMKLHCVTASLREVLILGGCLAALSAPKVSAADMSIERTSDNKSFNIQIIGKIERGDEDRFRAAMLRGIKLGLAPGSVTIFSPGGSVPPALAIGRQIRTAQMWTMGPHRQGPMGPKASFCNGRILDENGNQLAGGIAEFMWSRNWPRSARGRWTHADLVSEDGRCICASACFLMWAGGVGRGKGAIGVHRPYFDRAEYAKLEVKDALVAYNSMVGEVKSYLAEMDVPERIIKKMMSASSEEMFELDSRDFEDLDNSGGGEALLELQIAKCGSVKRELDAFGPVKIGQPCNKRCQGRITALHQKINEIQKCNEKVRDEDGARAAVDAYLAQYGDGAAQ